MCFHATLSIHPTHTLFHLPWVLLSVLYVSVPFCPENRFISTIFLDFIYMCVNIWYLSFSFYLTSLCIIGSRFIHLIRTDSNVVFLWLRNIPFCISPLPPRKRNAKRLFEEVLQIDEKRREAKSKGEKERYTHLNAEFQTIPSRDLKKPS